LVLISLVIEIIERGVRCCYCPLLFVSLFHTEAEVRC
jgi:hypothetical protein